MLKVLDGRVTLNGRILSTLGEKMDLRKDILMVDGKKVTPPTSADKHWILLHKPKAVLTTMKDNKERDTILSLIPQASELRLVPVGGMDRDDTGVLLLTNDIGWIHPLTHPSKPHVHRYEVTVSGIPDETTLRNLVETEASPKLGAPFRSLSITDVDHHSNMARFVVTLDQRSSQQLEDLCTKLGCTMLSTKRTEFSGIKLRGLRRGQWRELTSTEVAALKATVASAGVVSAGPDALPAAKSHSTRSAATTKKRVLPRSTLSLRAAGGAAECTGKRVARTRRTSRSGHTSGRPTMGKAQRRVSARTAPRLQSF